MPPTQIDLPLVSLLAGAAGAPSDLSRALSTNWSWPRFRVQWDGGDILVVSFLDVDKWPAQYEAKAWLVKMDSSTLQRLRPS